MAGLCPLPLSLTQAPSGNETSRVECNPNVAIAHSHYHWVGQVGGWPRRESGARLKEEAPWRSKMPPRCHPATTDHLLKFLCCRPDHFWESLTHTKKKKVQSAFTIIHNYWVERKSSGVFRMMGHPGNPLGGLTLQICLPSFAKWHPNNVMRWCPSCNEMEMENDQKRVNNRGLANGIDGQGVGRGRACGGKGWRRRGPWLRNVGMWPPHAGGREEHAQAKALSVSFWSF